MQNPERTTEHLPRSLRKQSLVDFTQKEIEQYESGQINRISSAEELQERFRYTRKTSVHKPLREAGLSTKRNEIKQQEKERGNSTPEERLVYPSTDWAWMTGVIAGGGHISRKGDIKFGNSNSELREAIKSRGERLFNVNARLQTSEDPKRSPNTIIFGNKRVATELGNFTRDQYVTTVIEKHQWVLQNHRYIWSFLEGIFETRGRWERGGKFMDIVISAGRKTEANFLAELLVRVGINNPRVQTSTNREGVSKSRLYIFSLEDIKLFSKNIHSVIPKREEHLVYYREIDPQVKRRKTFTREEIIREWAWMTAILGITPTEYKIRQLKKFGIARCSPPVYTNTFGAGDGGKSFGNARSTLEDLVKNRQEFFSFDPNQIQRARAEYALRSQQEKEQRRPRRMPYMYSDEDILQEWIKARSILGYVPTLTDLDRLYHEGAIRFNGIFTRRFGDGKSFSNAHDKLEILALGRGEKPLSEKSKQQKTLISEEELISEWKKMVEILGHIPSSEDIRKLRERGETKYFATTYSYRFGQTGQGKSFNKAKEILSRLVFKKDVNDVLSVYEQKFGKQIRFVPKIHRSPEEEAKRRLDQIIGYTEQESMPQVLYGHDGESIIFPPPKNEDITRTQRYIVDPTTKVIVSKESQDQKSNSQEIKIFP